MSSDTLIQVPYCQILNVIMHNSPLGAMHYSLCIMHPTQEAEKHITLENILRIMGEKDTF
jgi:hypothetical protein